MSEIDCEYSKSVIDTSTPLSHRCNKQQATNKRLFKSNHPITLKSESKKVNRIYYYLSIFSRKDIQIKFVRAAAAGL
jgi:hypothetical protein